MDDEKKIRVSWEALSPGKQEHGGILCVSRKELHELIERLLDKGALPVSLTVMDGRGRIHQLPCEEQLTRDDHCAIP